MKFQLMSLSNVLILFYNNTFEINIMTVFNSRERISLENIHSRIFPHDFIFIDFILHFVNRIGVKETRYISPVFCILGLSMTASRYQKDASPTVDLHSGD